MRYKDLKGQKFGRLTPLEKVSTTGAALWLCQCDCGKQKVVQAGNMLRKKRSTKSCGCACTERITKMSTLHGEYGTKLNGIWGSMRHRCMTSSVNHKKYKYYAQRGITVDERWSTFPPFKEWAVLNGYKEGLSIERLDNDKGYSPENCVWIPKNLQGRNRRTSLRLTYNGKTQFISEWANELGIAHGTIYHRIKYQGWSIEKTLSTPT